MLLLIRPDSWNFPLLLHVGGAMLTVASLAVVGVTLVLAWRERDPVAATALIRFAFRTTLIVVIPAYILMHGAAEWIASKEGFDKGPEPSWIGLGYSTADGGGVLLLIGTILTGVAARRAGRAPSTAGGLAKAGTVLGLVALVAFGIAIWAMTTKPT